MFCGWRLVNSAKELNELGSGKFKYDLIFKRTFFNGNIIENLNICYELDSFLANELKRLLLNTSDFESIILNVDIDQIVIESKRRSTNDIHIDKDQKPIRKGNFFQYRLKCACILISGNDEYIGEYEDIEEWPDSWP